MFVFIFLVLLPSPQISAQVVLRGALQDSVVIHTIGGSLAAYYELWVVNKSSDPILLKSLNQEVWQGSKRKALNAIALKAQASSLQLRAGDSAIIYLEVHLPSTNGQFLLQHHLLFQQGTQRLSCALSLPVRFRSPVVLGAPVASGLWAAVYAPQWERGHRRVIYTVDGKARIPGRYAIDFIRLDKQGHYSKGDEDSIQNWWGYAEPVRAVAAGVVVAVVDSFPEHTTRSSHPAYSAGNATGNYVVLQLGESLFAFYEHLKPGSLKVRQGQSVAKGAELARVGFTGQTTGPHLHFHLATSPSPLGSEGLPFVFEAFTEVGFYPDFEAFGKARWKTRPGASPKRKCERPGPFAVLRWNK